MNWYPDVSTPAIRNEQFSMSQLYCIWGTSGVQSFAFKLVSKITSLDLLSFEQSLKQYSTNNVLFWQLITWRWQKCLHRKSVIDPMFSISHKMDSVQHNVMPNSRLRMLLPLGRGLPATICRRGVLVVVMIMIMMKIWRWYDMILYSILIS